MDTGRRHRRRSAFAGSGGKAAGMSIVEYLVVALLVIGCVYLVVFWRPWEHLAEMAGQAGVGRQDERQAQPGEVAQGPSSPPARLPRAPHPQKKIHFVPVGDHPPDRLERLAAYSREKFGVTIETAQAVPLEGSAVDDQRRQVIAEELIALMRRHQATLAGDPDAILIGLVTYDMYIRERPDWRFGFAFGDLPRAAVISSARMDPINLGGRPDPDLLERRLRKMVSKYIGYMYFQLPPSRSRQSVMYTPILGVDDLDRIGENF